MAGLSVGTGISAVDLRSVEHLDTAAIWRLLGTASTQTPLVLDTDAGVVTLMPRPACPAIFVADTARGVSAGSDGTRIRVTTELLDFAGTDAELAAVLAHEIAHFVLCHHDRDDPLRPRSTRKREREADRFSARLLVAAGYDLSGSLAFWPRYGKRRGLTDMFDFSHGSAQGRLRRIVSEFEAARKTGLHPRDPALFAPFAGRGECHRLPRNSG